MQNFIFFKGMERKADILLQCNHIFCEVCLSGWKNKSATCPICRKPMDALDDTFQIIQPPSNEEIYQFFQQKLDQISKNK